MLKPLIKPNTKNTGKKTYRCIPSLTRNNLNLEPVNIYNAPIPMSNSK